MHIRRIIQINKNNSLHCFTNCKAKNYLIELSTALVLGIIVH